MIRMAFVDGGQMDPPLHALTRATQRFDGMTLVDKKDIAIQNLHRCQSFRWSIMINVKSGKLNYLDCTMDEKKEWTCGPAMLDILTERLGVQNVDKEYVLVNFLFVCVLLTD